MRPRKSLKRVNGKAKKAATAPKTKKQKPMVKTRLMQISLRLDDHIYNNKQISVQNAELYIQEIAAFKEQCRQDEPSLQVIEKLTRIMRAITDNNIEDTHSNSMTLVSPLPDNDRITSQRIISDDQGINSQSISKQDNQDNHFTLESINISDDDSVKIVTATGSDVTEFCELTKNVNVVDVTRAISTLSIDGESSLNLLNNYSSDEVINNCGQGIDEYNRASRTVTSVADELTQTQLVNSTRLAYLESNASKKSESNNGLCRKYLVSRPEPYGTKMPNKKMKISNDIKGPAFSQLPNVLEKVTEVENGSTLSIHGTEDLATITISTNNDNSQNLLNNYKSPSNRTNFDSCGQGYEDYDRALKNTTNAMVKQKEKAKSQNNRGLSHIKANASTNVDSCKELSSNMDTGHGGQCVKKVQNKNDYNKTQSEIRKSYKKPKTKTPTAQKTKITNFFGKENQTTPNQPKEIAKKKKPTTFVPPMKETKTVMVNNKESGKLLSAQPAKVEIDLSWVENLKYVRQINADEYSSMDGVNESFWKNCEFPENFDENDFNCS